MDLTGKYWEIYDDQSADDFDVLAYTNLAGESVVEDIKQDLAKQVAEIRRKNGQDVEIRLYKTNAIPA